MRQNISSRRLVLLCLLSSAGLVVVEHCATEAQPHPKCEQMRAAAQLAERWFRIIEQEKSHRGLLSPAAAGIAHGGMLGEEFSEITTTLGCWEAKETTLNPEFAAAIVGVLHETGIDSQSTVGITISGSFPALAVSALAAVQTLGAKAVLISSLGASSYGANQPGATWLDMENWLSQAGGLETSSVLVTPGGEGDNGASISGEGLQVIRQAASRHAVELSVPASLADAIQTRVDILAGAKISLLINIGGGQAMLGACEHSSTLPNGLHYRLKGCRDPDRGVMVRLNEKGIPVYHMLDIRSLARELRLPVGARAPGDVQGALYRPSTLRPLPVMVLLIGMAVGLAAFRSKRLPGRRAVSE